MTFATLADLDKLRARVAELEQRLERFERANETERLRILSEVKREVREITDAVQRHVDSSIRAALEPYLEKLRHIESVTALAARLPEILSLLERTERELVQRRARDEAAKELREQEERAAAQKKAEAEVEHVRREGKRTHLRAKWTVLGSIVVALIAAVGSCGWSYARKP